MNDEETISFALPIEIVNLLKVNAERLGIPFENFIKSLIVLKAIDVINGHDGSDLVQ
jgi:hypothetical protein